MRSAHLKFVFGFFCQGTFGGETGWQCWKVREDSEEWVIQAAKRKGQACQRKRIVERHCHQWK